MIELLDAFPDVNVQPAEYKRLLGYPRDSVLEGRARELADWARQWYAQNGRPWVYARQSEKLSIINGSILIDGVTFTSPRLQKTLLEAEAHGAILVAVSAGPEVAEEAAKLWMDAKTCSNREGRSPPTQRSPNVASRRASWNVARLWSRISSRCATNSRRSRPIVGRRRA